jgi:hypothetical protein
MSTKDNGGPAFPCDVFDPEVNGPEQHEGMTLRDYLAARAMQGLMSSDKWRDAEGPTNTARCAYAMADAMLKERTA